jgi:two-component system, chemotaxis family, chemotaxis protein CheY
LKRLGLSDVDEASDGLMALAKMREKKYALVISDWNMEPMSGYSRRLWRDLRKGSGPQA